MAETLKLPSHSTKDEICAALLPQIEAVIAVAPVSQVSCRSRRCARPVPCHCRLIAVRHFMSIHVALHVQFATSSIFTIIAV
jgi:hypothetical protein